MIRMNKRATPPFWGEPDDQYDTGARSTTALELRDFGVDANSRLPNRRREHGRDKGVEVADTYVILNTNPVHGLGPFKDGHAALGIVSDDGDPEKNVVWDPNGYYPDPEMGTERTCSSVVNRRRIWGCHGDAPPACRAPSTASDRLARLMKPCGRANCVSSLSGTCVSRGK